MFDVRTGRGLSTHTHGLDILEVSLSQFSQGVQERKLAFVDSNRDLYVTPVTQEHPVKLCTMVDCIVWNDCSDMLAALADGQLVTWMYPGVVFVDKDLLEYVLRLLAPPPCPPPCHVWLPDDFASCACLVCLLSV